MFEDSRKVDPTAVFPALAAAIDAVSVHPEPGVPAAQVLAEARALVALRRRLDARLLARLGAVDAQGLATGDGFTSTASWVRGYANLDAAQAVSLVKAARVARVLPALADVLAQGKIGLEHLQAVAAATRRVPDEVLAGYDQTLRDLAPHAHPHDLRVAATKIQAVHDADAVAADADHVRDSRYLSVGRTFGDAYYLQGLLPPEAGASLVTALDSLMASRGPEDSRTATQRRADALSELTILGLASGQLPDRGGDRPRLTFLVRTTTTTNSTGHHLAPVDSPGGLARSGLSDIAGAVTGIGAGAFLSGSQQPGTAACNCPQPAGSAPAGPAEMSVEFGVTAFGLGDAALIGTDALFPAATIARICCDADLSVAMVNGYGEPLNLGRTSRHTNRSQRRALAIRDQGCVFPGCDWPPARCQAHHLRYWWSQSGPTDLDNLALICWFHHQLLHEGGWTLARIPAQPSRPGERPEPPGWLATSPDGHQLRQHRQPAA